MKTAIAVAVLALAACTDPAEIPDSFHVVMVPGTVVVALGDSSCSGFIGDGAHFYIVGGPDNYSASLTQAPSGILCTWSPPTMTCDHASVAETLTLTIDGDRARVESVGLGADAMPWCRESMDATIEPL